MCLGRERSVRGVECGRVCGLVLGRGVLRAAVAAWVGAGACVQSRAQVLGGVDALDEFLAEAGTAALRAEHLERVRARGGPEGAAAAGALAGVYAELLRGATGVERAEWSLRASGLLEAHRELAALPLRLVLATGRFADAEGRAEAMRLGLGWEAGSGGEGAGAEWLGEELSQLADEFATLADIARREARGEEERQRAARVRGRAASDAGRQEAESLRLTGKYYEGWCHAHLAVLGVRGDSARRGTRAFSAVLDSGERELTLDRLPREVLRYEQAARAAVGMGLCLDAAGEHAEGRAWLTAVIEAGEVDAAGRRLALDRALELALRDERFSEASRLAGLVREVDEARTLGGAALAVAARGMRFLSRADATHASWGPAIGLTTSALNDLVRQGRTAEVLGLLDAYSGAPLENAGFVADYLRGLRTLRVTEGRQAALGEVAGEPTADAGLAAEYRGAAERLDAAARAKDAAEFAEQRVSALMAAAQATFLSGELRGAAARFAAAALAASDAGTRQNASWMRVVCLDRIASGSGGAGSAGGGTPKDLSERDDAAREFLREHPESPRSASLLMRLAGRDLVPIEQAVAVLSAVPRESEAGPAARRQLAVLLFQWWQRATGEERAGIGARLMALSAELADEDLAAARAGREEGWKTAVIRARQVIEVGLSASPVELGFARRGVRVLTAVEAERGSAELRAEIAYHGVRVALASGDGGAVASAAAGLREGGGAGGGAYRFALARVLLTHAADRVRADAGDLDAARMAFDAGRVLMEAPEAELSARARAAAAERRAEAAGALYAASRERVYLEVGLKLDEEAVRGGSAGVRTLRRHAAMLEAAGRVREAADAWLRVLAAEVVGVTGWFEARAESLRLLAAVDVARARAALAQHRVLYPDLGPQPWRTKIAAAAEVIAANELVGAGGTAPDEAESGGAESAEESP